MRQRRPAVSFSASSMVKPRVFLDSSIFIAALLSARGGSFYILEQNAHYNLQTSEYVLEEVQRIVEQKFPGKGLRMAFFLTLGSRHIQILKNPPRRHCISLAKIISPGDSPILASALIGSDYLLTLDNDFFSSKVQVFLQRQQLIVLKPKDFLEVSFALVLNPSTTPLESCPLARNQLSNNSR